MYISFNTVSAMLPEKRSKVVFSNPDLYITFKPNRRFVIWDSILSSLDNKWFGEIKLWPTEFDFGSHHEDYTRQFDDYSTIELLQFPTLDDFDVEEQHAFVYDSNGELYISEKFVQDLKLAGCVDVWYDTTAPFGRY